jgi:hypothetical protein|nr:DUF2798 domain-containing protein [Marinobacter lutaoensis]
MSKQRRARVRQFIFAFYMSGIMSMMMSGVITVINTGLAAGFFARWGSVRFSGGLGRGLSAGDLRGAPGGPAYGKDPGPSAG